MAALPPWMRTFVLLSVPIAAIAQTVTPVNGTASAGNSSDVQLTLQAMSTNVWLPRDLLPLSHAAGSHVLAGGLMGHIFLANDTNYDSINAAEVALISCDPYSGFLQSKDIYNTATSHSAKAVVFYSQHADSCNLTDDTSGYQYAYTTKSRNDSIAILGFIAYLNTGQIIQGTISTAGGAGTVPITGGSSVNSSQSGSPGSQQQQGPLGPSPSTAVAMIILYSITGIITALFLVIIVTGAVRAHRHPERYGPRGGTGRPRQSRARGLARAMLDSLPIVKVGEREEAKQPADVELLAAAERAEAGAARDVQTQGEQHAEPESSGAVGAATTDGVAESKAPETAVAESAIAAAAPTEQNSDAQGCSICTEDFKPGEDQRVLPCDHRFHPDCVDPWLLNVSGTCPLCRIDLRPATARSSVEGEEEELAPPLETEGQSRRMSIRRSILFGITGMRPDRLSREERILALRELRGQQLAARRRVSQNGSATAQEEAETSLRRRLRNAFRIRTRRLGEEDGEQQPPPQQQQGDATRDQNSESSHQR